MIRELAGQARKIRSFGGQSFDVRARCYPHLRLGIPEGFDLKQAPGIVLPHSFPHFGRPFFLGGEGTEQIAEEFLSLVVRQVSGLIQEQLDLGVHWGRLTQR